MGSRLPPHKHIIEFKRVVMQKLQGVWVPDYVLLELAEPFRKGTLTESEATNYVTQLLQAVQHLHNNGMLHRDIKPDNLLLKSGCLKLADLGYIRAETGS